MSLQGIGFGSLPIQSLNPQGAFDAKILGIPKWYTFRIIILGNNILGII